MKVTELRARIVGYIHTGHNVQEAFVATLTEDERQAEGTRERWSAKDVVAHVTSWKSRRLLSLDAIARGEEVPVFDMDGTNAQTWEEQHRRSWEDVLAEEVRVVPALIAHVERLSADDLTERDRFTLPSQPLAGLLVRNAYTHPLAHITEHARQRGQMERAIELQTEGARALSAMADYPELEGAARYNLACCYALASQPERAIPELRRALALNPALVQNAREDADLASLRAMPDYQALVAGA
jgi:tetratricopeptide (TPR) repeat protein